MHKLILLVSFLIAFSAFEVDAVKPYFDRMIGEDKTREVSTLRVLREWWPEDLADEGQVIEISGKPVFLLCTHFYLDDLGTSVEYDILR